MKIAVLMLLTGAGASSGAAWNPRDGATARLAVAAVAPQDAMPSNLPQLSLARPYAVYAGAPGPLVMRPGGAKPAPADASDWNKLWTVDASIGSAAIAALRRDWGIRGRVIAEGDLDTLLRLGAAADYPGVVLRPAVTADALANRFGVGFDLRMAADLIRRIPFPTLDLGDVTDAGWATLWIDDCVRNGVVGLHVILPGNRLAAKAVESTLARLRGPNVYLPPASEVAILVSDSHRREAFGAYAGLRASGVWPEFVGDAQLTSRSVSLAKYHLIVVPSSWAAKARPLLDDAAKRGATVVILGAVDAHGAKVIALHHDGRPAITERRIGDGRWITAGLAPWSADGAWKAFWDGLQRDAGIPRRPWLESVTAANVGRITGKYTHSVPAK